METCIMKFLTIRSLLFNSGAVLLLVGLGTLLVPHAFYASNGSTLGAEASLLSEVRAHGALLAGCGTAILLAAFRRDWEQKGLQLSALAYLSIGLSRILSLIADGMPSSTITGATVVEILVGLLCLCAYLRLRSPGQKSANTKKGRQAT